MRQSLGRKWERIKDKRKRSQKTNFQPQQPNLNRGTFVVAKTSAPTSHSDTSHIQNEQKGDAESENSKDLWQVAFEKLPGEDQQILSTQPVSAHSTISNNQNGYSKTLAVVDDVVQITGKQYEEYQNGSLKIKWGLGEKDINLRDTMQRILNAALSFKDIISAVTAFDPTGHASSAWALVSLGLTVCSHELYIDRAIKLIK